MSLAHLEEGWASECSRSHLAWRNYKRDFLRKKLAGTICFTCGGLKGTRARDVVMSGTIFTASVISMSAKPVGIKRL